MSSGQEGASEIARHGEFAPIAVGGVGGSGTRLVARLLRDLGFFLGADLNESEDTLWFTHLFKRREVLDLSEGQFSELVSIFRTVMTSDRALSVVN